MKTEPRLPNPPSPTVAAVSTPAPGKSGPVALPAAPRRAESERLRSLGPGREPEASLGADGQLFSQLIQPVGEGPEHQGLGGGGAIALPVQHDDMPTELIDELAQRLAKDPLATLDVTLLMPTLGKVQVRASPRQGHWGIELGFTRRDVLRRLRPRQRNCEAALAAALGQPVTLSMLDEAER
ncbi:type III secretion system HrpP C-terminal domain-containing protein [Pseudomonas typographi]|uniref:type III secretion system HrpP C-terminal domain-containing protein n=2 Tax=Pseudomonas typographi TaxID=2715964 RepID=UPI001EEE0F9E|nr:type III secretion system HrpP C-terminal domain-containing protein [Pseudomonas typographi]